MRKILSLSILLICVSSQVNSQAIHIYGGSSHRDYLGCLNCDTYDPTSIWNEHGTYGSSYNEESIWNDNGAYGSEYSPYSPWNEYSTTPPVLVDEEGNFYGYFTVNEYKDKQADFNLVLIIYKYHEFIKDNVAKWHEKIFE